MSAHLLPETTVRDATSVRRYPAPPDEPRLLWPSTRYREGIENHDSSSFPAREVVYERRRVHTEHVHDWGRKAHHEGIVLKLLAFEAAIESAVARILVLDPHFDHTGLKVLGPALQYSQAWDVRLLTGRSGIDDEDRERWRRTLTRHRNSTRSEPGGIDVRWRTSLNRHRFPFLHDRFAIVDGALWHFGSTVGGGHPGLTAASGPWCASDTRADEFFEECWGSCNA